MILTKRMQNINNMVSVCTNSWYFLRRLNNLKNELHISDYRTSSTVAYIQGQSPESKIREYFYYIDHQGMVGRRCIYFF